MQKNWTKKEISYLRENYHIVSIESLVNSFERSNQSIRKKAFDLGLKRGVLSDGHRESITTTKRYESSHYKKCLDFAKSLGFNNVSEAVDNFGGSRQFTNEFKKVG